MRICRFPRGKLNIKSKISRDKNYLNSLVEDNEIYNKTTQTPRQARSNGKVRKKKKFGRA